MTDEEKDERDDLEEEERDNESDDYDDEAEDKASDDDKSDDDDEKAAAPKKRKKKRRKKKAAKAAAPAKPADDDDDDDDDDARPAPAPTTQPQSGGGSMMPAIVGVVVGLGGGFFIGKSQAGGEKTVDASQDSATAVASATGTNGKGGPCEAYATALCEKVGATNPVCAQAKQASTSFMTDKTCVAAMGDIGATVTKLQAARKDCDKLVADLCKELGDDSQSCKLVKDKTPQFPAAQCTKMLENYDQVLKQLQQQEMRNKPISSEMAQKLAAGDVPAYGPKDAKVTIVEFSDFECPYCARAAKTVDALKKAYPEGVRVVFRQFPLPMHKNAQLAAEASLAAHAQGKFWAMHDKLFENSRSLSRETIDKIAAEIGLDMAKFKKQLDDGAFKDAVEADKKLGGEIGVSGTPTMLVNTKRVQNPGDMKGIQKLVEEEGGPKAKETEKEEKKDKPEAPGAPKAPVPAAPKAPAPAAPKAPAPKAPAPAAP